MQEYNELINSFCDLKVEDKRNEVMKELQELMVLFQSLCISKQIKDSMLLHPEMNDYKKETGETEFLNSAYAYLISTKELVGKYLDK